MRKKTLVLCLSLVILVVFTACGGGGKVDESAKKKFDEAIAKTTALDSIDLSLDGEALVKQGSQEMSMTMSVKNQSSYKDMQKPEMRYSVDAESAGQNMKMDIFYKDEYLYVSVSGQKFKSKIGYDAVATLIEESAGAGNIGALEFSSDTLLSLSTKEEGDNTVYEFAVDPKNENAITMIRESMLASLNEQAANSELEITECKGTLTANKDGYMTDEVMQVFLKAKIQGQTVDMRMDLNAKFNNPGEDVKVTPLDKLNTYTEIDPSLLNLE